MTKAQDDKQVVKDEAEAEKAYQKDKAKEEAAALEKAKVKPKAPPTNWEP